MRLCSALSHDQLNRLFRTTDYSGSGSDFTYLYDGGGERVAKFPSTGGATRREFARLIIEGRGDASLSCTPDPFTDVTCAANPNDGKYVQKMKDIGITSGCGGGAYCPDAQTQRDQSSVFFLKGEATHCPLNVNNCTYTPPSCTTTHVFADVPCPSQYADWVGELYAEGITAGCGSNNFCPTNPLGSWQMLAWANKIWGSYAPLPRASLLTYRDEGARVVTEANQSSSTGDASEVIIYPRDNVFLGSQLVSSAMWSGTTANYQFYAVDHLGSTRLVTDINAASFQTLKYWPYGDDGPGTGADAGQRLKFDGMERDGENKHYYDHARTEDFNIGRFLSPDLLTGGQGNPQSWNRYSFVGNSPISATDPLGLWDCKTEDWHVECLGIVLGQRPVDPNDPLGPPRGTTPVIPDEPLPNHGHGASSHVPGKSFGACVAGVGDSLSLQRGLQALTGGRVGNGFIAEAMLGNDVSALINVGRTFFGGSADEGAHALDETFAGRAIDWGIQHGAPHVPNLTVAGAVSVEVFVSTPSGYARIARGAGAVASVPLGSIAHFAAAAAETFGLVKAPYDVTMAGLGAILCSFGS